MLSVQKGGQLASGQIPRLGHEPDLPIEAELASPRLVLLRRLRHIRNATRLAEPPRQTVLADPDLLRQPARADGIPPRHALHHPLLEAEREILGHRSSLPSAPATSGNAEDATTTLALGELRSRTPDAGRRTPDAGAQTPDAGPEPVLAATPLPHEPLGKLTRILDPPLRDRVGEDVVAVEDALVGRRRRGSRLGQVGHERAGDAEVRQAASPGVVAGTMMGDFMASSPSLGAAADVRAARSPGSRAVRAPSGAGLHSGRGLPARGETRKAEAPDPEGRRAGGASRAGARGAVRRDGQLARDGSRGSTRKSTREARWSSRDAGAGAGRRRRTPERTPDAGAGHPGCTASSSPRRPGGEGGDGQRWPGSP